MRQTRIKMIQNAAPLRKQKYPIHPRVGWLEGSTRTVMIMERGGLEETHQAMI